MHNLENQYAKFSVVLTLCSNTMNKLVMKIELWMKLRTILPGFMVSTKPDSNNGSLAGQALDKLLAPHKPLNYFGLYTTTWNRES